MAGALPHPVTVGGWSDAARMLAELAAEVERRQSNADAPDVFLFIHDLARFRDLRRKADDFGFSRREEDAGPADHLLTILREGPGLGIHVVTWCDNVSNLNRSFDQGSIREFEMRVLFQMSQTDSGLLLDAPHASRLGPRPAPLFFSEDQNRLEKFRPYGRPSEELLGRVRERLRGRPVRVGSTGPGRRAEDQCARADPSPRAPSEPGRPLRFVTVRDCAGPPPDLALFGAGAPVPIWLCSARRRRRARGRRDRSGPERLGSEGANPSYALRTTRCGLVRERRPIRTGPHRGARKWSVALFGAGVLASDGCHRWPLPPMRMSGHWWQDPPVASSRAKPIPRARAEANPPAPERSQSAAPSEANPLRAGDVRPRNGLDPDCQRAPLSS